MMQLLKQKFLWLDLSAERNISTVITTSNFQKNQQIFFSHVLLFQLISPVCYLTQSKYLKKKPFDPFIHHFSLSLIFLVSFPSNPAIYAPMVTCDNSISAYASGPLPLLLGLPLLATPWLWLNPTLFSLCLALYNGYTQVFSFKFVVIYLKRPFKAFQ